MNANESRTRGRPATTGIIPGRYALSVGMSDMPCPKGWHWTLLTDVARLESGHTPSRRHPEYWDGETPWVGIRDATSNHGQTIMDTSQHVTVQGLENSAARLLPAGTICLSRTASIGYVVRMGRPMATSQDFVNWVCSEELNERFLMYILIGEKDSYGRFAHGTTHQTIYFPEVKAFHICLPPRAEQDRIVALLGSLDDKIELNRRMSQTLEAMAQALFRSWFVDFNPVKAKAEGRQPEGMDAETADRFPNRFVESVLGKIPAGWRVQQVGEVTSYLARGIGPSYIESGGVLVLNQKCIREGRVCFSKGRRHDPQSRPIGERLLQLGDVLINSTGVGTLGRVAQIDYFEEMQVIVDSHVSIVRAQPNLLAPLLLGLELRRREPEIEALGEGSTGQTELSRERLRTLALVVAPLEVQQAFVRVVTPLRRQMALAERESKTLAELRDTLLPKILSGELRVQDAEAQVARST